MIKDLSLNEEMDSNDMAAIHGGIIKIQNALPIAEQIKLFDIEPSATNGHIAALKTGNTKETALATN